MRDVIRSRGRLTAERRRDRTRVMAMLATFFFVVVGMVAVGPGLATVSATGSTNPGGGHGGKCDHHGYVEPSQEIGATDATETSISAGYRSGGGYKSGGHKFFGRHYSHWWKYYFGKRPHHKDCDAKVTLIKTVSNEHGGSLQAGDFQLLADGEPVAQNVAHTAVPGVRYVLSEVDQPGYVLRSIVCVDDKTHAQISNDGSITVAAGQRATCEIINDDIAPTVVVHKAVVNDNGGSAEPGNFQMTLNGDPIDQGTSYNLVANAPSVVSEEDSVAGYAPTSAVCTSDIADSVNNKTVTGTGAIEITPAPAEHIECTITNDDAGAGLTLIKTLSNADGGNEQVGDFPLQVNGVTVASGELVAYQADVDLAITETQLPGWSATNIHCASSDPASPNNIDIDNPDVTTTLATVSLQPGEAVVCTITNDDIAPTVTVHKVVVGGPKVAADFQMTINFEPVDQDTATATLANTPIEVSEIFDPAYTLTSTTCVDNADGAPLEHPLVLDEAQNATCTVTNSFQQPTITVHKDVTNLFGGTLGAGDFQLTIDGVNATQGAPAHVVAAGAHVIDELAVDGYQQTGIVCTDVVSQEVVGADGEITLVAGQNVDCVVFNADIDVIEPTLTLTKRVINNDGGTAVAADFNLQIDGSGVPQGAPQSVAAGTHVISEVAFENYRLIAINCTDNDNPGQTVVYNGGVTLALEQNVTCQLTNDDSPIDLAITKTDDGLVKVAGGAAFDYTISVDNLGPRDALTTEAFTVTDKLPTGLAYVSFPTNCIASSQTLTCAINPTNLQVQDPPVVLTVRVRALADAASGTYTNMAYVSTPADPACVGLGCVPVCNGPNNNVACENTDVRREASIAVDKVDDVPGAISPGATYSYFMKVTNPGPSTFLEQLRLTDDLPTELTLLSVVPGAQWTCNAVDPLVCNYGQNLQVGETTSTIQIVVRLDPNFLGNQVINTATAIAIVDPAGASAATALTFRTEAPGDPGTEVTDTDDETTPVVRQADLAIDKSVSQATAKPGDQIDWTLDITNLGPNAATNLVIDDALPAQFEVLGAFPTAGLTCTNTTTVVQCTGPSLFVGETLRVVVQVRVVATAAAGPVTNTATVTADSVDPNLSNNSDSASIDISVAQSEGPVPPNPAAPGVGLELPRTGGTSPVGPLTIASILVAGGLLTQVLTRRRRPLMAQQPSLTCAWGFRHERPSQHDRRSDAGEPQVPTIGRVQAAVTRH